MRKTVTQLIVWFVVDSLVLDPGLAMGFAAQSYLTAGAVTPFRTEAFASRPIFRINPRVREAFPIALQIAAAMGLPLQADAQTPAERLPPWAHESPAAYQMPDLNEVQAAQEAVVE